MDGHKFDVFVKMPDGTVTRLYLIALQDLYSGKFVAWRLSESENKETTRLVIGDMVERYGIPERITLDNGRAFASKWITGGAANRYRFKVRDEDPQGLTYTVAFGGERLDRIAKKLMQTEAQGTVEALLEANPGLAAAMQFGLVPADTVIRLPAAFTPKTETTSFTLAWE